MEVSGNKLYLSTRNRTARIIGHDTSDNPIDNGARIATVKKIIARDLYEELILARGDRWRGEGLGVQHVLIIGGFRELSFNGPLNTEHQKDEDQGREDLEESGPLVPP